MTAGTLVCAVDFSEPNEAALTTAETLAKRFDAELVLAHVVEPLLAPAAYGPLPTNVAQLRVEAEAAARDRLQEMASELKDRGVEASVALATGPIADTLVDIAREREADLVVLATHGLTGLEHALLGSVAERVVRLCPCPVLSVKPPRKDR